MPHCSNYHIKAFTTKTYHISSIIRQNFSFQNNPKDLDPSCKVDLDLWDCLGQVKTGIIAKFHRTKFIYLKSFYRDETPVL